MSNDCGGCRRPDEDCVCGMSVEHIYQRDLVRALGRIEVAMTAPRALDEESVRADERAKCQAEIDEANARLAAVSQAYDALKAKEKP